MGYRGVPTVRKRIVGRHLRTLRKRAEWSLEDVAHNLGLSRSAADRKETGYTAVSVADMRAYLDIFEVTDPVYRAQMEEFARLCTRRGWWARYQGSVGQAHVDLADAEDLATEIYCARSSGIPTLLETEAYARAELEQGRAFLEFRGLSIDKSVELRMRRKQILGRTDPPKVQVILSEGCLLAQVGDAQVMRDQVQHLLDVSEYPHVHVRVLPFDRGVPVSMGDSSMMRFAPTLGNSVILAVDGSFDDEPEMAELRCEKFKEEWACSLSEEATRAHLHELLASIEASDHLGRRGEHSGSGSVCVA